MNDDKREILVKHIKTGEIVKRIDVTGKGELHIERCMMGILINMNQEDYRIVDTDWSKE
ncbi:MAG: hypothetical protein KKD44_27195 [Proteobacteria bacterium]|nr:hypothetical protein [Pseudomonadota bacterium]